MSKPSNQTWQIIIERRAEKAMRRLDKSWQNANFIKTLKQLYILIYGFTNWYVSDTARYRRQIHEQTMKINEM